MASGYNANNKRTNKLLLWLIIVSFVIHIPVYLHMNGMLSSKIVQYIDLSLREIKKPFSRGIPRPPMIPKEQKKDDSNEKILKTSPINLPELNNMYVAQSEGGEGIGAAAGVSGIARGEDYKEMVLRRIEREKKKHWQKEDDGKYKEGVVSLSFIIRPDGTISDLKILKPSKYKSLNEAALKAVRNSVPFPKPPPDVYKGGLEISPLNLSFELL